MSGPGAAPVAGAAGDAPPEDALERLSARAAEYAWTTSPRIARAWLVKFSPAGRALTLLFIAVGSVSAGFGIVYPLYGLATFLLMASAIDAVVGLALRPRVKVERDLPERVAAGATVLVRARLTNLRRVPCYEVAVTAHLAPAPLRAGTSAYAPRLGPGETVELTYALRPARRGAYDVKGVDVLAGFPFGIYHAVRTVEAPRRLLVYPRFGPLGALDIPVGTRHQPGGLQLLSKVGESEEYVGDREYRPGDRLRDLDVRAWARRGGPPIVREYQQEYLSRVALVLDTHVPRRADPDALEAAISLGASVADALSRLEYVVDLFACGPDLYHLTAGRSLAYLDSILDILACLEPCAESPFERLAVSMAELAPRMGTAVVLLLDWTDERAALVRALADRGVAVKAIVVRDGPPTLDPAGAPVRVQLLDTAQARAGADRL